MRKDKITYSLSPLALLTLAACGGGTDPIISQFVSEKLAGGPLLDTTAFNANNNISSISSSPNTSSISLPVEDSALLNNTNSVDNNDSNATTSADNTTPINSSVEDNTLLTTTASVANNNTNTASNSSNTTSLNSSVAGGSLQDSVASADNTSTNSSTTNTTSVSNTAKNEPLEQPTASVSQGNNSAISSASNTGPVSGSVEDGPLKNAIAFLDYNDNGLLDIGEPSARTDATGGYSLTPTQENYSIVAITDENTIDTVSGAVVAGITLKAPSGSIMVTPTTTLMEDGNLTASEVMMVLGLPEGLNPLTYSAHADISGLTGSAKTAAENLSLQVELANQQILSVVNAFAAAAEGSGVGAADAFEAAIKSVAEEIKVQAATNSTLDLSNQEQLAEIKLNIEAKVDTLALTNASIKTTEFSATMSETVKATGLVNAKIQEITNTDLSSSVTQSILATTQVLKAQVAAAAKATVGNTAGDISFANADGVALAAAATNEAPTDMALSSNSISESSDSLVVGNVSTTDAALADGTASTVFKYAIAKIDGTDHAAFSIDATTGVLSLMAQPDYETQSSYSITILSTDEGGKTLSKEMTVSVTEANNASTIAKILAAQGFQPLSASSAAEYNWSNNDLSNANLAGRDLGDFNLAGANLKNANLVGATLSTTDLTGADLTGADLRGVNLQLADLEDAILTGVNLGKNGNTATNLTGATLTNAKLSKADLTGADLGKSGSTVTNLTGADLTGVKLNNADLESANLSGANLTGADLTGTTLTSIVISATTNLTKANLTGANLTGLDLSNVNLSGTDLTNANLTNVNLTGANLNGTIFTGATLTGSIGGSPAAGFDDANEANNTSNENQNTTPSYIAKADAASSQNLNPDNNVAIENLMSGYFWGSVGSGIDLTYSFMSTGSNFAADYDGDGSSSDSEVPDNIQNSSSIFQSTVADIFELYSSVSLLNFSEVSESGDTTGHIRIGTTSSADNAFAYLPYTASGQPVAVAGDVWLQSTSNSFNDSASLIDGTYWNNVTTHEIGHALGLAHTHEAETIGGTTYGTNTELGSVHNSLSYSVMAYPEYVGGAISLVSIAYKPTTLMIDDIAALQYLYGVDTSTNSGDTTYTLSSFSDDNLDTIYASIWDAGGTDTFSWSDQSTNASINLNGGSFSCFGNITGVDDPSLKGDNWSAGDGLLGIAYNSVIENAIGGSASDNVVGNSVANTLYGGSGSGVKDTLTGNGGADIFVCSLSDATTDLSVADSISDFTNGTDFIGLEDRTFSDLSILNSAGDTKIIDTSSSKILFLLDGVDHTLIDSTDFVITDFV